MRGGKAVYTAIYTSAIGISAASDKDAAFGNALDVCDGGSRETVRIAESVIVTVEGEKIARNDGKGAFVLIPSAWILTVDGLIAANAA